MRRVERSHVGSAGVRRKEGPQGVCMEEGAFSGPSRASRVIWSLGQSGVGAREHSGADRLSTKDLS